MTARLAPLDPERLDARQREIFDDILSRRGGIGGPFPAWLRNPELAERAQKLGAYCRFDTSLSPVQSELAILVVARHWRAQAEWAIHAPIARKAGLPEAAIEAILADEAPSLDAPDLQVVHDYTRTLLRSARVSDELHARACETLGESGVIDLVGVIGYYGLVALTLNAFEMAPPDGGPLPFAE